MDVVQDSKDFLGEFVSDLEKEERELAKVDDSSSVSPTPEVNQIDVWTDIEEALHRWTCKILDAESRHDKTASFRDNIEASLRRQQLDGFLDHHDVAELRHVADLFINLLHATSCYRIGCVFLKRDIITLLLELYSLKQITNTMLVEACLQL